ncbi:hypothetical protein K7432_009786 [Basidiobolus ranarum]|uniref:Uncharacterized protein n=1 Tax=Basidiobolus ranarum TaxID=34480 RepID=A0ABR2VWI5_9FUNG
MILQDAQLFFEVINARTGESQAQEQHWSKRFDTGEIVQIAEYCFGHTTKPVSQFDLARDLRKQVQKFYSHPLVEDDAGHSTS